MSEELLQLMLKRDTLGAKEVDLINIVTAWGKKHVSSSSDEKEEKKTMKSFVPLLRFPLLSATELASTVASSGLLEQQQLLDLFTYTATKAALANSGKKTSVPLPTSLKSFSTTPRKCLSLVGGTEVYICDYSGASVKVFTPEGDLVRTITTQGSPTGCYVYEDELFVANNSSKIIEVYPKEGGTLLRSFGSGQSMSNIYDVVVRDGHVYVCDYGNTKVTVFSVEGVFEKHIPCSYQPLGFFFTEDEIYYTDYNGCKVAVMDFSGTLKRSWGSSGSSDNCYSSPWGVIVDDDKDEVYISDRYNHRIQVTTKQGVHIRNFGSSAHFNDMTRMCFISDDLMVTSDMGNSKVELWNRDGTFVKEFSSSWTGKPYGVLFA
eukprot:TRINITY_DN466_c0_g1_i1.p1 TRINITY_DN466_c0_g1~~TRINITY_DN466_c0_g1_i1.p1  ORF type:complete len:376 (+),score=46.70 TRINITY_DN466_c0_g1_i1:569-1696(+)